MRDKSHAYLDLRMFVFRYAHVGRTDHSHIGQIDRNRNPGSPGRGLWRRRHATFYLSLHQLPFGLAISLKRTPHAGYRMRTPPKPFTPSPTRVSDSPGTLQIPDLRGAFDSRLSFLSPGRETHCQCSSQYIGLGRASCGRPLQIVQTVQPSATASLEAILVPVSGSEIEEDFIISKEMPSVVCS